MRLGLISDSHDHLDNIERAIDALRALEVEGLIHAGDFIAPFAVKRLQRFGLPIWAVKGNNDGEVAGLRQAFESINATYSENTFNIKISGRNITVQHIPQNWDTILGGPKAPDVLIFGHTHQRYLRQAGDPVIYPDRKKVSADSSCPTLIVNPGELCGWLTGQSSFAVLDLKSLKVDVHFL